VPPTTRLFGTDGEEIFDLDGWFEHAPPEKKKRDWKDGYSAKEQAKAWLRSGIPRVPEELWTAVAGLVGEVDEIYGRPEHLTSLDRFRGGPRHHDMLACTRRNGKMVGVVGVVGVEAKACEDFDGTVGDRAKAAPPSKKRARCNLLARALFGREVMDGEAGYPLDQGLASHGYQLWTATVGTIIEAQKRGVDQAIVVVHQFRPHDLEAARQAGDTRPWVEALDRNLRAFNSFAAAIDASGSCSHETEFVKPGTAIHLVKIESYLPDAIV
jgi:hypothetical protein